MMYVWYHHYTFQPFYGDVIISIVILKKNGKTVWWKEIPPYKAEVDLNHLCVLPTGKETEYVA